MNLEAQDTRAGREGLAPSRRMRARFTREVAGAGLAVDTRNSTDLVSEAELSALPQVTQRYMKFMGVIGRPRTWSFRLRSEGSFRLAPDKPWMPCEAWQYDCAHPVARIFHMRLRFAGFVPMLVRDTYVRGRGHMSGRILDAVSVVDEADAKIATGELVTYLNDAILFAPSMLLGPATTWQPVDAQSFDVTFHDRGRSVTARVFVDERGAVTDFNTTDRFGADPENPKEMVRARWSTPIRGWRTVEGRPRPTGGTAVWHFRSGEFPYADFDFGELAFDVSPGDVDARS